MEDGGPPYGFPFHHHTNHAKRTHSDTERNYNMEPAYSRSESPLFVPRDAQPRDASPQYRPRLALPPRPPRPSQPPPPPRYPGDGLDFRRPVSNMSNRSMQVIDLTDDDDDVSNPSSHATPPPEPVATASRTQRLPRYNRQIIDLSTDSSPADAPPRIDPPPNNAPPNDDFTFLMNPHPDFTPAARASPEVEFVFERPLSRNQRPQSPPRDASPQVPEPLAVDLTQDLDDEVVHVRTEGRAGVNLYRPQGAFDVDRMGLGRLAARIWAGRGHGPRRHGAARLQGFAIGGGQQIPDWMRHDDDGPALLVGPPPLMRRPGGGMPDLMNYETVAFELGLPEMPPDFPLVERERQRSPPKYEAPPPVKEPFTRSPVEDESLVCPNCGDELAVGATEEKKQVWIVRSCGHVYCGECMINRKKQRKSTKGKGRAGEPLLPEPFTSCQAKDHQAMLCGVRVSHVRDVMQIFL